MKCIFCGKYSGLIRREHPECRAIAEEGKKYLRECIDYIYNNRDCLNITEVVQATVTSYNIPKDMYQEMFLECWDEKVQQAFSDGVIDDDEIKILMEIIDALGINKERLSDSKQWKKLIDYGTKKIDYLIEAAINNKDYSSLKQNIYSIAAKYRLSNHEVKQQLLHYWNQSLDRFIKDGVLEPDDFDIINKLSDSFELNNSDIEQQERRIVKALLLHDIIHGILPHRFEITRQELLPFSFQKNETLIWGAKGPVLAYEEKQTKRQGVTNIVPESLGEGFLLITNKNLYWSSPFASRKIQINKIGSIISYADGIKVIKIGVTARPLFLHIDDPHFYSILLNNLNRLS